MALKLSWSNGDGSELLLNKVEFDNLWNLVTNNVYTTHMFGRVRMVDFSWKILYPIPFIVFHVVYGTFFQCLLPVKSTEGIDWFFYLLAGMKSPIAVHVSLSCENSSFQIEYVTVVHCHKGVQVPARNKEVGATQKCITLGTK